MGGPRAWVRCESPYTTEETVNGSQSLIRSLLAAGVDICPMNPGTSEMHFVSALDDVPEMRGVVGLFEGGATGAADGYARIAGEPNDHRADRQRRFLCRTARDGLTHRARSSNREERRDRAGRGPL